MYIPHLVARMILAWLMPPALLRLLSPRLQTRVWHKVHGPLLSRRKQPRVLREYVLCDLILRSVPQLDGRASIVEFGCSTGALTQRLLHFIDVARKPETDVVVYGFDTFEGLPEGDPRVDYQKRRLGGTGGNWVKGTFHADMETLDKRLRGFGFSNFELVKGLFSESLTTECLEAIKARPPFLVIIDCDYYTSTVQIFEKILPVIPNGCVFYFDDTFLNHYSSLSGELRAIQELNAGIFGGGYELVEAYDLGLLGRRFFRFVSLDAPESREIDYSEITDWVCEPSPWLSPLPEGRRIGQKIVQRRESGSTRTRSR